MRGEGIAVVGRALTSSMLEVSDLVVKYGETVALKGISVRVEPHSAVFVVGANGAGKSSLLKAIAGVQPAVKGRVLLRGVNILGRSPESICRSGLTLVPEGRHIFGTLTVRENLAVAMSTCARADAYRRLDWVMELFPVLRERYKTVAGNFSGGEQQQLAIARALIQKPDLLLIDEPSLGLAPIVVDDLYATLRRLKQEGLSLLIVEQNVARLGSIADKVHILSTGKVVMTLDGEDIHDKDKIHAAYFES